MAHLLNEHKSPNTIRKGGSNKTLGWVFYQGTEQVNGLGILFVGGYIVPPLSDTEVAFHKALYQMEGCCPQVCLPFFSTCQL